MKSDTQQHGSRLYEAITNRHALQRHHNKPIRLDIRLSPPGSAAGGTNPEQLFAAGWSACFEGAMGFAARKLKVVQPPDVVYFLRARLNASVPGVPRDVAQAVVDAAHQTCPYSKAIRGNVDVEIKLV